MMNTSRRSTTQAIVLDARERNRRRMIVATAVLFSLAALALLLPRMALAQTGLSKCTDGNRITYSSTACETIGLKTAGQIADRLTIIPASDLVPPALSGSKPAAQQAAAQTASAKTPDMPGSAGSGVLPINPLVQGLLIK